MADYERLQRLGAGNFGEVWLVYDRALDVKRAVKYVRRDRIKDPTNLYDEPRALMALRHDHIVRVEDAGRERDTLYIAMEYLPRGSVESRYKGRPVELSRARQIICGVCWGLEYAHQQGYIHRDIKPANILIASNGRAKLSDFGLATRVPRGESASPYGYLTHLAPEVLRDGVTTPFSDIYALGMTAYRLINGDAFLPDPQDHGELQDLILSGEYPDRTHYRPYVPSRMKRVVNSTLAMDPAQRPSSAAQFRRQLESIPLLCDWKWKPLRDRVRYNTRIGDREAQVSVIKTDTGRFEIDTRLRPRGGKWRRRTKDCSEDLTLAKMKPVLRRLLARFVTNGS